MTYRLLLFLIGAIGLFLSAWIVIPAPILFLLPLAVGAPEVSLWLLLIQSLVGVLSLQNVRKSRLSQITLGCCTLGLLISLLPLSQFSAAAQAAETAMVQGLGENYLAAVPADVQAQMRSHPLTLATTFRGIATAPVRQTIGVPFAAPDGVPLSLNIYRPPQAGSYPALVMIYGGAWQRGSPSDNAVFARYMAAQGYVVWAIAYRYAPQYQFPAQLEDVQAGLAFVQQHAREYETDPNRIALMGRSAGAHLAMLAAYQPDAPPIRAVVNYYGPVDLLEGYFDLPNPDPLDVRAVLRDFLGGPPDRLQERYRLASPIHYVTRPLPPTLLVYGDRDHIVLSKFGRQLAEQLEATGSRAIFLGIPWAEHAFDAVFNGLSNQLVLYHVERFLAWALQ